MSILVERPVIALISNPQTAKIESLPNTGLMQNPVFAANVKSFDDALGLKPTQSLEYHRQIASTAMSVATHNAFLEGLRSRLPYAADGRVSRDPFNLFLTGHSVGEMASFIEAGIVDINSMAYMLAERERITNRPLESGIRLMLAMVNVDMANFRLPLKDIRSEFGKGVRITLANFNNPMEGVLSLHIPNGVDIRTVQRGLGNILDRFRHPEAEKPVRIIHLTSVTNAFHSKILSYEQQLLNTAVAPYLTPEIFRTADPGVIVYSAITKRRIKTPEQGINVFKSQLITGINFPDAMDAMLSHHPLLAVTCDPAGKVPENLVEKNTGPRVRVVNIKDLDSLGQAVDLATELISSWRETHLNHLILSGQRT